MTKYREVMGFPVYRVGTDGSLWTKHIRGAKGRKFHKEWVLYRGKGRHRDYVRDTLYYNGKSLTIYRHRLVLETFIGPCPKGMECCHKNDIKNDNRLSNLSWGTRKKNMEDSRRNGGLLTGEDKASSKLRWSEVKEIRRRYKNGETIYELADAYNVAFVTIAQVIRGDTWKDPNYKRPQKKNLRRGERHPRAKLTEKQVKTIRKKHQTGDQSKEKLAKEYGVSESTITRIINRDTWQ